MAMQHAEICRTLTEKINLLKDKHEMLSSLLPDVRLLYGTQPGPRTPVMYQPGIVFLFSGHKIGYIRGGGNATRRDMSGINGED